MNKIYSIFAAIAFIALAAVPVYAAKPDDVGEKANPKAAEAQSKNENRKMEMVKPVSKYWFYPELEEATETYDYEMEPWGHSVVNHKKGTVMYIGHNHEMGTTYYLYQGDTQIGYAEANEDGVVKIRGEVAEEGIMIIKTSEEGEAILTSSDIHLKGMEYMEEEM